MKAHRQDYQKVIRKEHTSRAKPVLSGLLLGSLIGAGTALLFAPQSGERTRAEIQNKTIELKDRTTSTVNNAVSQVKAKTREMTSNVLGKAEQITHQGREMLENRFDDMSQTVTQKRKAVRSHTNMA